MALAATRDAAAGDAASQWLLGSLYLLGLGVPQDRHTGMTLMQTATRSALPAIRAADPRDPMSEMQLFSTMVNLDEEALPQMVQDHGAAWAVASYKQSVTTILQVLSGCR
jgi:TPR repeat protein